MDLITKIEKELTEEQKTKLKDILKQIEDNTLKLANDSKESEDKLKNAIDSRDKTKEILRQIKQKIGLDENLEFDFDVLAEKMNKDVDLKAIEDKYISQLKSKLSEVANLKSGYERKLKVKDEEVKTLLLDSEIFKLKDKFRPVKGASDDIMRALKVGAKFEDGKIRYYDENGAVVRNSNQVEATVLDKLAELKTEKSFYFSNDPQNTGGNTGGNNTPHGKNAGGDAFQNEMVEKMKKMSYGR